MQKPEYIKIEIPVSKYYFRKIFCSFVNYLKNKNAVLNFGRQRDRKSFDYKIIDSKIQKWYTPSTGEKSYILYITLEKITD